MNMGWLPQHWVFNNAVKIGAVVEATLFSFALALRIKIAEQEKNAAIDQSARRERELLESKQAELEIKVAERTASLQASLEARRMMLANVSHELRSPVNALSLLLDTPTFHRDTSAHADPTDQANPKSHQQHALTQARDISAHLARLIENLLRLEVDAQTSHPNSEVTPVADCPAQAFELGATLHAIAGMVAPLQLHGNARFDVDVSACQGRWVMGDETALRRILVNVLSNAFKFTVNGQVKLQASVTARTGDDVAGGDDTLALRFLIHDTGCGIEPTMQAQIFEPFVTTVGPRSGHTGTGLGLPLARQLARQLGGDLVLLHSTPGQGSRFECTLRLPRADAPALATSASQTPLYSTPLGRSKLTQPLVNTLASSRGLRILLAEDCPVTAHALECILRSLNHEVMHVADFQSLIAQLNPVSLSSFDLALIDHRLPGGSGLDFARRCRAMEQPAPGTAATSAASPPVRHLPIVLMTGDVTPEVILEADAVCDDLIAKPTTAQRLEQLLGRGPSALPVLDEHLPAGHRDRSSSASTLEQVIHERFADAALQSLIDPRRVLTLIRHGATHDDLLSMCHQFADSVHAALRDLAALPVDPPDAHHTHRTAPTQGQDPSLSTADAVIHRVCSGCVTMGAVSLATQFRQWPQASVDSIHASFERTQRALEDLVVRLAHHKPSAL